MKAVLNGRAFVLFYTNMRVHQGSMLGHRLFLILINSVSDVIISQIDMPADDPTI